ncbi:MAG: signal peptidase I [Rickettsiales bacterium]|nr:signal peptidase I [Rickettsiales bacterium]|tara:strand:+ start:21633 stop:22370 length:738 start_codon:yes stop_codon:yes gene_type:complete
MKKKKDSVYDNVKTLFLAILAAILIRSFLLEPFSIPSGSMYPNLKVGDYLFVSKSSYGFSRHSFPFSVPVIPKRILYEQPNRGDIVVFKTPEDNKTDYIKRLIGLPGDKIRIENNEIFINDKKIAREKLGNEKYKNLEVEKYKETLPNGKFYYVYEIVEELPYFDTDNFSEIVISENEFFVIGDNRDNSQDSRFIGNIPKENLVGKALVVMLSFDGEKGSWWKFWTWISALRKDRFFFSLLPDEN